MRRAGTTHPFPRVSLPPSVPGMAHRYFSPKLFSFVKELTANNERDWFKANKERYELDVKEPALDFIEAFAKPLAKISPHFSADPRPVGGSLFRIHRDTRFSKDKTPYKTHIGIHFRHFATREDVHAPGYYLHLEPGGCFAALGLWRPATDDAYAIRQAIAEDSGRWKRATRSKRFTEIYDLDGESLVRPPKGFDPDDPLIDDLKRKDFLAVTKFKQSLTTSDHFMEDYTAMCRAGSPLMKILCGAVGVPF